MTLEGRGRMRLAVTVAVVPVVLVCWLAQSANAQTAAGRQARRGEPAAASAPTPRLADGTPNLGRVPGEKGAWGVPYITNMAARVILQDGTPAVASGKALEHSTFTGRGRIRPDPPR